jgi:hypothetical protein
MQSLCRRVSIGDIVAILLKYLVILFFRERGLLAGPVREVQDTKH